MSFKPAVTRPLFSPEPCIKVINFNLFADKKPGSKAEKEAFRSLSMERLRLYSEILEKSAVEKPTMTQFHKTSLIKQVPPNNRDPKAPPKAFPTSCTNHQQLDSQPRYFTKGPRNVEIELMGSRPRSQEKVLHRSNSFNKGGFELYSPKAPEDQPINYQSLLTSMKVKMRIPEKNSELRFEVGSPKGQDMMQLKQRKSIEKKGYLENPWFKEKERPANTSSNESKENIPPGDITKSLQVDSLKSFKGEMKAKKGHFGGKKMKNEWSSKNKANNTSVEGKLGGREPERVTVSFETNGIANRQLNDFFEKNEKNMQKASEKPNERPLERPLERLSEKPSGRPSERPPEKTQEKAQERPQEKPQERPSAERPSEKPLERPFEKQLERPEKPAEKRQDPTFSKPPLDSSKKADFQEYRRLQEKLLFLENRIVEMKSNFESAQKSCFKELRPKSSKPIDDTLCHNKTTTLRINERSISQERNRDQSNLLTVVNSPKIQKPIVLQSPKGEAQEPIVFASKSTPSKDMESERYMIASRDSQKRDMQNNNNQTENVITSKENGLREARRKEIQEGIAKDRRETQNNILQLQEVATKDKKQPQDNMLRNRTNSQEASLKNPHKIISQEQSGTENQNYSLASNRNGKNQEATNFSLASMNSPKNHAAKPLFPSTEQDKANLSLKSLVTQVERGHFLPSNLDSNSNHRSKNSKLEKQNSFSGATENKSPEKNQRKYQSLGRKRLYYIENIVRAYHVGPAGFGDDAFVKLSREHFTQTFQSIIFAMGLKPINPQKIKEKALNLARKDSNNIIRISLTFAIFLLSLDDINVFLGIFLL